MNSKNIDQVELLRIAATSKLDLKKKSTLGQFFTPIPICQYMASLFNDISGDVRVLDPGCGVGSLTAALVEREINSKRITSLHADLYDIEDVVYPYLKETMLICKHGLPSFVGKIIKNDFIFDTADEIDSGLTGRKQEKYSHVIMNPPYKKIATKSEHRLALRKAGIEAVNLYSGFVGLAINKMIEGGELVAIIPRSFCNGPYYLPFRELLLNNTSIQHIHIFEKRNDAFSDNDVLQENIIIHCVKGTSQGEVVITSSPSADFHIDEESGEFSATDLTIRKVPFNKIVSSNDKDKFIHIAASPRDQKVIDRLSSFNCKLNDLELKVSTGPVVGFRLRSQLRQNYSKGDAALLYPAHMKETVHWPLRDIKPNAINVSDITRPWLWNNEGHFLAVRRFSSKEEKRRIVATIYDGTLPGSLIGFENKLNVFHYKKSGVNELLVKGLYVYLNSSLLDKYYRQFGGHTQVNATDLRNIHYPDKDILLELGRSFKGMSLGQKEIDGLLEGVINNLLDTQGEEVLSSQQKIEDAMEVLAALGMPRAQLNERSALTLLALLQLEPNGSWEELGNGMIGVTPIMDWCRDVYGKEYAPNTRETFRRQTLHQFVDAGMVLYNPDQPDRAVNSPKACYQIAPEILEILKHFGDKSWDSSLSGYLKVRPTLIQKYAMEREMQMIPLTLPDGTKVKLSAGVHSQLIKDIVTEFGPRFVPGAEVIYLGDTGAKEDFFNKGRLEELGVAVNRKGKLPDAVLYWEEKDWLILVESVTSHGPVDGKRHGELSKLFESSKPGLVYVTAFPDRKIMTKYLADISWETEVWTADAPTHMIHFNGDRFLGPHS